MMERTASTLTLALALLEVHAATHKLTHRIPSNTTDR